MATLLEKLEQAEDALHQLMLGKAVVSLNLGERRLQYTEADRAELESYIARLRRQLAGRPARRGVVHYMVPR